MFPLVSLDSCKNLLQTDYLSLLRLLSLVRQAGRCVGSGMLSISSQQLRNAGATEVQATCFTISPWIKIQLSPAEKSRTARPFDTTTDFFANKQLVFTSPSLIPQLYKVPSEAKPYACQLLTRISITSTSFFSSLLMILGAPKVFLSPHTYISPESVSASEYFLACMSLILLFFSVLISTLQQIHKYYVGSAKNFLLNMVPSWPLELSPHEQRLPLLMNREWFSPAAIDSMLSSFILVGRQLFLPCPLPNCPQMPLPKAKPSLEFFVIVWITSPLLLLTRTRV